MRPTSARPDARLVRRLWDYIRPHRRIFWAAMICLPLTSACSLAQLSTQDRHRPLHRPGRPARPAAHGHALRPRHGGRVRFLYLQYYLMMLVAQRSLAALRVDLVTHLQELPTTFFDRNPVGRLVTRLTTDVDVINEMFAAGALTILMDVATLLGIVAIMMTIDWHLAAVTWR
jgi:ATP-binding cassette subfamily B protein